MSKIQQILQEIAARAQDIGVDCASNMHAAATLAQVESACQELPFKLPSEVVQLYLWRNGVKLEGQPNEIRMFPHFYFRSVEISAATTKVLISNADDPEMQWKPTWFCLCTDLGGDCYALEAGCGAEVGRIYAVKEVTEPFPAFWCFEKMLLSVLECYRAGVYFVDEDGLLAEDYEAADGIYRRINHGLSPHYAPSG